MFRTPLWVRAKSGPLSERHPSRLQGNGWLLYVIIGLRIALSGHPHMPHDYARRSGRQKPCLVGCSRAFVDVQPVMAVVGNAGGVGTAYHTDYRQGTKKSTGLP